MSLNVRMMQCAELGSSTMPMTVTLDDNLIDEAERLTGIGEQSALINLALGALIQRENAKRLTTYGSSLPAFTARKSIVGRSWSCPDA